MTRQLNDHYGTPPHAVRALLDALSPDLLGESVIEPCFGTGRIASVLAKEGGCDVFGSDLVRPPPCPLAPWPEPHILQDLRAPEAVAVLKEAWSAHRRASGGTQREGWCVTNPPYGILQAILPTLLDLAPRGALLLRLSALERASGREILHERLERVVILGRVKWINAGGGVVAGTDTVASAWFVYGEGGARRRSANPVIEWASKGE